MYLSGCVGCVPIATAIPFWTQIQASGQPDLTIFKKGQPMEVSELLNRNGSNVINSSHYNVRSVNHRLSPPPTGLANLRALCATDMEVFTSRVLPKAEDSPPNKQLKFGINRILSDDFGKEKENHKNRSPPEGRRFSRVSNNCPCPSTDCSSLTHLYSSISSVHSIHPSLYHYNSGSDILPGPYSILSTETHSPNQPKRKRSWSRAVFSNLQRKGLEKRFEVQKYVTKPDRRQLAAMLGLTDAQVKVWFQNRRMKWRHAQQIKDKGESPEGDDDKQADLSQSDEDINVTEDISDVESEANDGDDNHDTLYIDQSDDAISKADDPVTNETQTVIGE